MADQRHDNLLDHGTRAWLFDTFAWAMRRFNGEGLFSNAQLVLPSSESFPDRADEVEDLATAVLARVQAFAGMSEWPCVLVPHWVTPEEHQRLALFAHERVLSEWAHSEDGESIEIHYDVDALRDPMTLVATFAYELASMLVATTEVGDAPGESETLDGHVTEVVCAMLGFGVFTANVARDHAGAGGYREQGYLGEAAATYALAIFVVLKDSDAKAAERHLDRNLRRYFRACLRDVRAREDELDRLRIVSAQRGLGSVGG